MCGFAAIFNYRTTDPIDPAELRRISDAMSARGPDSSGLWLSPGDARLGLGHRRLAIIDPSPAGAQPMIKLTPDGPLAIAFNGEIYNYRQLRSELEDTEGGGLGRDGHSESTHTDTRFVSQSDTEVLLELYRRHGDTMLERLRGMFALVIWDGRKSKRRLLAARDGFGIKPLYIADDGRTLRIASQVK